VVTAKSKDSESYITRLIFSP